MAQDSRDAERDTDILSEELSKRVYFIRMIQESLWNELLCGFHNFMNFHHTDLVAGTL